MTPSSLFDLSGAVALVTGASSGLGRRFALVLAQNGASVVLVARRKERLEALAAEIEAAGGHALPIAADVGNRTEIARAFDAAQAKFGTVTVLINNAGVAKPQSFLGMRVETWRETLDINLDAVVATAQEAARRMVASGGGAIVNIASILSFGVQKGNLAYAVSKAAVLQATRAMALGARAERRARQRHRARIFLDRDQRRPPCVLPGRGDVARRPNGTLRAGRRSSTARFSCSLHALGASSPERRSWSTAGICSRLRSGEASLSCGRTPM